MIAPAVASDLSVALADLADGRFIVLLHHGVDGPEAALAIAAEAADASAVNYLARKARGLVCLAMDEALTDRLALSLMPRTNRSRFGPAFTVSIEAASGIETGISARDRALTIAAAIRPDATPRDLVTPGHVFPIRTEREEWRHLPSVSAAAVELCRRAGQVPAAAICALMGADGAHAGAGQARIFAAQEGLSLLETGALALESV